MDDVVIRTKRLVLRRFRHDDSSAMHPILSDPDTMRYWSTPPHDDFTQTQEWIDSTITSVDSGNADEFIVIHGLAVIGKAGLWHGSEIGFILARATWGHGFATEAVEAVCKRAFAQGRDAITADVDPRNDRSLRLLSRLGFRETGRADRTICLDGVWANSVYLECRAPPAHARE